MIRTSRFIFGAGLILAVIVAAFWMGQQAGYEACAQTCEPLTTPTPVPTATPIPPTPTPVPPGSVAKIGQWNDTQNQKDLAVAVEGNRAYLGHVWNIDGVDILDISNPALPVKLGNYGNGFTAAGSVEARNNILYVSSSLQNTGTWIADVNNPAAPVTIARITIPQWSHNLDLEGDYLYIADNDTPARVYVYNVANPASPFLAAFFSVPGHKVHDLTARGNHLYVSAWTSFSLVDITNPVSPVVLSSLTIPNSQAWPTEDGRYIYAAYEALSCQSGEQGGIRILDAINPASLVQVGLMNPGPLGYGQNSAYNVNVVGNRLYTTWHSAGVKVFDIANPVAPVFLGGYDTTEGAGGGCTHSGSVEMDSRLGNGRLVVSDWNKGLYILNVP